jgi:hypothetical protein
MALRAASNVHPNMTSIEGQPRCVLHDGEPRGMLTWQRPTFSGPSKALMLQRDPCVRRCVAVLQHAPHVACLLSTLGAFA